MSARQPQPNDWCSRRAWLAFLASRALPTAPGRGRAQAAPGALAAGLLPVPTAAGPDRIGPVTPPRAAPALPLVLHDGRQAMLPALLRGHVTALQLMFTGCSARCPVQGAVFAALQGQVQGTLPNALLLSLSIDPVSDDRIALAAWRRRFAAGDRWLAAAPPVPHAETMVDFVQGRPALGVTGAAGVTADRHNAQVFLFDAQGRLAYRLAEFAAPRETARAMIELARAG